MRELIFTNSCLIDEPDIDRIFDEYYLRKKVFHIGDLSHKRKNYILFSDHFLCVRNQSLFEKYPGGVLKFVIKHGITFNKKMAIVPFAPRNTILKYIQDLAEHEMDEPEDFVSRIYYPEDLKDPSIHDYYPLDFLDFHNEWLGGRHTDNRFEVFAL